MALKLKRGTEADRLTYTPEEGELLYTTDAKKVWVGDGTTAGGIAVTTTGSGGEGVGMLNLIDDTTPQLGGNLDLNNFSITGDGEININGNIYATGNINLGDNPSDTISVAGKITGSLVPVIDGAYSLGTLTNRWGDVYTTGIVAEGTVDTIDVVVNGTIRNADSSVFYDATSQTLSATTILADQIEGALTGDLIGSVFADDSTVLVDGISGNISNGEITLTSNSILLGGVDNLLNIGSVDQVIPNGIQAYADNITITKGSASSSIDGIPSLTVTSTRNTLADPIAVEVGDFVGQVAMGGYDGADYRLKTLFLSQIDTVTGANTLPGKMLVVLHDADGNYTSEVSVNSKHELTASKTVHTAYADVTARDADITSPVAGMMVFVTDGDGAGNPQFQGYTGSAWVALN